MSDPNRNLDDLLGRLRDGMLDDDSAAELERLILDDPAAMDRFIHHRWIDSGLTERFGEPRALPAIPDRQPSAPLALEAVQPGAVPRTSFKLMPALAAVAAAILLAAAAIVIYALASSTDPQSLSPHPSAAPIATLIESSGTVIYENDIANAGSEYAPGTYSVDSGSAELLLISRVGIHVQGHSELAVRSPMRSSLRHGIATFDCPPGAEGYAVVLPTGDRVVDLGTRFRLAADAAGRSLLHVLEGSVRLHRSDGSVFEFRSGGGAAIVDGGLDEWDPGMIFDDAFGSRADEATGLRLSDQRGALAPAEWTASVKGPGSGSIEVTGGRLVISSTSATGNTEANAVLDRSFVATGRRVVVEYELDHDAGEASTHDFKIDPTDPTRNPASNVMIGARVYPRVINLFVNGERAGEAALEAAPKVMRWVLDETDPSAGRLSLVVDGRTVLQGLPYPAGTEQRRVAIGVPVGGSNPPASIGVERFTITQATRIDNERPE